MAMHRLVPVRLRGKVAMVQRRKERTARHQVATLRQVCGSKLSGGFAFLLSVGPDHQVADLNICEKH